MTLWGVMAFLAENAEETSGLAGRRPTGTALGWTTGSRAGDGGNEAIRPLENSG
jgi:hypothetical protein